MYISVTDGLEMPDLKEGESMSGSRPPIPAEMKRELRREAHYGCVCCGNPIIEYHHIKDWCIVKEHTIDNLVVLCPSCHYRATVKELTPERILRMKKEPYNSKLKTVSENFFINQHGETSLLIGSVRINNANIILRVNNDSAISLSKDIDGYTLLNLKIYDEHHKLVAQVKDNEWCANVSDQIWDITFSKGILDIRCSARKLWLKISTNNSEIKIDGKTYTDKHEILFDSKNGIKIKYDDHEVYIKDSKITFNGIPNDCPVIQIGKTMFNTGAVFYYD